MRYAVFTSSWARDASKGTKFAGCVGRRKQNSRCTASELVTVGDSTVLPLGLVYSVAFAFSFGPEVHLSLACKCLVLTRAWVSDLADVCCVLLSLMMTVMAKMAMLSRTERLSRGCHHRRRRRASCVSVVLLVFTYRCAHLAAPASAYHKRVVSTRPGLREAALRPDFVHLSLAHVEDREARRTTAWESKLKHARVAATDQDQRPWCVGSAASASHLRYFPVPCSSFA